MELKDMTFPQVLQLEIFQEELDQQMQREMNAYTEAKKHGKVARMALTSLIERGKFTMADMTAAYYHIMHREAEGYSANERKYIKDVCAMAYQRTIKRIKAENDWKRKHPHLYWWREIWRSFVEAFKGRKAK